MIRELTDVDTVAAAPGESASYMWSASPVSGVPTWCASGSDGVSASVVRVRRVPPHSAPRPCG